VDQEPVEFFFFLVLLSSVLLLLLLTVAVACFVPVMFSQKGLFYEILGHKDATNTGSTITRVWDRRA
jgi:hypothetical protein